MVKPTRWIWMPIVIAAMATLVGAMPNLDMALETQKKLVASRPDDARVHNDLANLFVLVGQNEAAEMAYQQALQLAPDDPTALFNLALLREQNQQIDEAERLYRRILEVEPQHAWSFYQLGTLFADRGNEEKAVNNYARAFGLNPRLSLASHNPHVIDNEYITRALIEAHRYMPPAGIETPLVFGEGNRIGRLMSDAFDEGVDDRAREIVYGSDDEAMDPEEAMIGSPPAGGVPDSAALVDEDIEQDEVTGNRVLTSDSIDRGSQLGKATGGSTATRGSTRFRPGNSARTPARRPSTRPRFTPGRTDTPVRPGVKNQGNENNDRPSGSAAPSAAPTVQRPLRTRPAVRFRPGVNSTGRLELELLAPGAQSEERWAKLR